MASTLEKPLLLPFLAPSIFRQPQITRRAAAITTHCTRPPPWPSRPFSTTISSRQEQEPQRPQHDQSTTTDDLSPLLDDTLDYSKGVPTAPTGRTSHFQSAAAQHYNPPSRGASDALANKYTPRPGNSVNDLLVSMKSPSRTPTKGPIMDILDLSPMLDPTGRNKTPSKRTSAIPSVPEKSLPMKLNASAGRIVRVDEQRGVDPARAFRTLEVACARNNVRRDSARQRYHERPGLKRKRLRIERWRKRFQEGFKGVVSSVMRMKRQGW